MTITPLRTALMIGTALAAAPALANDDAAEPGAPAAPAPAVSASAAAAAAPADPAAPGQTRRDEEGNIVVNGDVLYSDQITALRTPTQIIDVPQSLTITTQDEILERGWTSIGQIVDYTPGVNTSQGEGHRDAIVFRGVRSTADFYIDGVRDDVQYYRGLYNLEQVEILRGPNALLFGRGGTGGILNRVTKKGVIGDTFTIGQAAIDTYGEASVQGDVNFALGDQAALRLNASYENLDNHRDFYDGERIGVNPTLRVALGEATVLDLSYEFADHFRFVDRGIPTGADGRPVEALADITFGDPEENFTDLRAHLIRANIAHEFSENLKGNFAAFYGDYDKVYSNFYATDYDAATNVVELDGYIDETDRQNLILSGNLIGGFETGQLGHTLIVGAEYINTSSDQFRFNSFFSSTQDDRETFLATRPLSLRGNRGVNAAGEPVVNSFSTDLNDDTRVTIDVFSAYVQDEVEVTDWLNLVLGGRYDRFEIAVNDVVGGSRLTRTDEEFTPRGGLILKPQENISIYASYSRTFLPRSGEQFTDLGGGADALEPDTFTNLEAGIKVDFDRGLSFTAAVFEIEQSSPQPNDNDPDTLDVIDSTIQGFELQLDGTVTDFWTVQAGFSYLDGEQVNRFGPTGLRPRELPEVMASIWNSFAIADNIGIGAGLTHQGDSFADNGNNAILPAYTRVDAAAWWDVTDRLRLQVNVENVTDELYFPNAHAANEVTVGQPFNARFALTARF
jgi:catecholate siderophore receptor